MKIRTRCLLAAPLLAACLLALPAAARPLADIKAAGTIVLCTNPNALPFSSRQTGERGVHVEIAQAVADALAIPLKIEWVGPKRRMRDVVCDLFPGTRADPSLHQASMKLTRPYARADLVLGFARGVEPVADYRQLSHELKVGAVINSAPTVAFGKVGIRYAPYTYQEDLLDDLAKGELKAAALPGEMVAYYMARHPDAGLRMSAAFADDPAMNWSLCVGLPKSDAALQEAVDGVIGRMLDDGSLAAIYARYGLELRRP